MAGSGEGEPEAVGEDVPVAVGLGPDWDSDEHATRAAASRSGATSMERCLMCSFGPRVDRQGFQPVSVTGQQPILEAR